MNTMTTPSANSTTMDIGRTMMTADGKCCTVPDLMFSMDSAVEVKVLNAEMNKS
jgi:hypothetical protein